MRFLTSNSASPVMILYATTLHVFWGACFLFDPSSANSTALAALHRIAGVATAPACFAVAVAAVYAFMVRGRLPALAWMLPQQAFLIISAVGAAHAIQAGHFADGVERSRLFIASDQAPALLAAVGHTISVLRYALRD